MRLVRPSLFAFALLAACGKSEAPQLQSQPVTKGSISEIVSATGGVEALVTVTVGSQVSGTIDQLKVDFNSQVKKGQLLARIDPRPFQAALAKAEAGVASADAQVVKAQAAYDDSKRIFERTKELKSRGLVAQADVDTAQATAEQNNAALVVAQASVKQSKADLQQARLNLEFTRIVSPVDGIVISRAIDVGQTVAAAFQAPTLFTIANDLTKMRVLANIDEADVGKVKDGQEVHFTVDSYPGRDFVGNILQVRQNPTTLNNVVTYAAEILAPNPRRELRQGMTAAVQVVTARRDSVLRVPNAALRWKPEDAPGPGSGGGGGPGGFGGERGSGRGMGGSGRGGGSHQHVADNGSGSGSTAQGDRNEVLDRPVGVQGEQNPAERREQRRARMSKVYKLVNGTPVAANVRLGISDGHQTEVLDGLAEGDQVVTAGTYRMGGGRGGPSGGPGGPRRGLF